MWFLSPLGPVYQNDSFKLSSKDEFSCGSITIFKFALLISFFIIYFVCYEYINMYYNLIMLFSDGFLYYVEDDLFPLTLGCDLELNCIVLIQFAWLVCE